jgi:hypothetical protein
MTDAPKLRQNDREVVLAVFTREMPHTARILNAPAVTEEVVFGPDHATPDDDELPPQEWYDRHSTVLDELVADGILQTGKAMGMLVYGLTIAYQQVLEQQALTYLENKAKLLRDRAEDKATGMSGADLLSRSQTIEDACAAIAEPVVAKVQP